MWNNKKQQKMLFSLMSNLQTYYHFKLDFQRWLKYICDKRHKDNQLQGLELPCKYPCREC